ncbi:MAG: hypothetical protein B6D65_00980 [candidate division Zixibacteria bacterium 4484_93]|nr:MAG: hypothetical protein B6D65_00980 [candidate division Zixibacteria bacterium 4484_93]
MIIWMISVILLNTVFLYGLIQGWPVDVLSVFPLLVLLVALAIIYRVYKKTKEGRFEKLERDLANCEAERTKLLKRLKEFERK